MNVIDGANVAKQISTMPIFTGGEVKVQPLVGKEHTETLNMLHVHFAAGARTKFHTHTNDQVLLATEGEGIVATREREQVMTPGMVIHVPPGEVHWHGATKHSAFSHISINPAMETEIVE